MLIEGPSGAGKSRFALQLMERGARLVADDRVRVWTSGGRLFGRAPPPLHGLIEARGVGVLAAPALPFAEVTLALAMVTAAEVPERVPEPEQRTLCGVAIPLIRLDVAAPGAAATLHLACGALGFDSPV